jgi:hypothetical protein
MRCCPFQYLMSPMLCSVVMISSGLIAVIILRMQVHICTFI